MSMIEVNLGRRTRRFCGWMTKEQDMQTRHFMGVLMGQDTIAYSLSEDGQELTLYKDDTPTMIMTRVVDDIEESDEHMEEPQEMTAPYAAAAGEYVSIGSTTDRNLDRCIDRCRRRYERCIERAHSHHSHQTCSWEADFCIEDCHN